VFEDSPLSSVAKAAQKKFIDAFIIYEQAKKEMRNFTFLPVPPIPKITYCITGTLSISRTEMISYLEQFKWSFSNQVSRHTDILIVGESPGETKTRKAKELNILTINENEIGGRL
jgi:NAD-dependent DNA ligase